MVDIATFGTFAVAAIASLFMAWAIGAGSSGSTRSRRPSARTGFSVMRAGFLVGLLGFAGAVLQGANVSEAVGTGLIGGVTLSSLAATIALLIAAGLVAIGIFTGYPIATAFTVTGAVIGTGLAMGGDPAWAKYTEIATLWVLTPFVGGGIAYAVAGPSRAEMVAEEYPHHRTGRHRRRDRRQHRVRAPRFAGSRRGVGRAGRGRFASRTGDRRDRGCDAHHRGGLGGGDRVGSQQRDRTRRATLPAHPRGLVAFSAGGSQVGLAIGPLIPSRASSSSR